MYMSNFFQLKPAEATAEQIRALPAVCKASLPASFASKMPTDVAKANFVPIVQGSAEVNKGDDLDQAPVTRPTTTVYALLGKVSTGLTAYCRKGRSEW
jgi:hypothetical protein